MLEYTLRLLEAKIYFTSALTYAMSDLILLYEENGIEDRLING